MRYRDILTEGVKDYMKMFQGFPQDMMQRVKHNVQAATQDLKRQDRVVWYLRYFRIVSLWYQFQNRDLALTPEQVDKAKGRAAATVGAPNFDDALVQANEVVKNYQSFKHYVDLNLPDIDKIVWDRQTPDELLEMMSKVEKKWQENLKNSIIHTGDEDMILDCGNGWAWFDLNTYYCKKEADAMGHCGNAGGHSSQTILSLRKKIAGAVGQGDTSIDSQGRVQSYGRWSPRATFILGHNGILGEMKGRFNEKPEEKYHPQIMALLRHNIIKGIKGGGYAPENNFALSDLNKQDAEKLKAEKPGLRMAWEMYKDWHEQREAGEVDPVFDEAFREKLTDELEDYRYDKIDWDEEDIIIDATPESAFFRNFTPLSQAEDLFEDDGLEELIVQFAPRITDLEAREIAQSVTAEHYTTVVNYLLGLYQNDYELSGTVAKWDQTTHKVIEMISIRDYLMEDDEVLSSAKELNSTRDDHHNDHDWHIEGDEVDEAFEKYLTSEGKNKNKGEGRDLIEVILRTYIDRDGNIIRVGGGRGAPDPNQLKFDF